LHPQPSHSYSFELATSQSDLQQSLFSAALHMQEASAYFFQRCHLRALRMSSWLFLGDDDQRYASAVPAKVWMDDGGIFERPAGDNQAATCREGMRQNRHKSEKISRCLFIMLTAT
jgi:hypothetical protein